MPPASRGRYKIFSNLLMRVAQSADAEPECQQSENDKGEDFGQQALRNRPRCKSQ